MPALSIAAALEKQYQAELLFVGTARGLESRLVPQAGHKLELINVGQLKNVSMATRLRTMLDLPLSVVHCRALLKCFHPDVVIGVGGYASGPAMIAAILSVFLLWRSSQMLFLDWRIAWSASMCRRLPSTLSRH